MFGSNGYAMLRRVGASAFSAEVVVPGGPATHLVDLDGDGDLDGACCGGSGNAGPVNNAPAAFEISLNDGSGRRVLGLALGPADRDGRYEAEFLKIRARYMEQLRERLRR